MPAGRHAEPGSTEQGPNGSEGRFFGKLNGPGCGAMGPITLFAQACRGSRNGTGARGAFPRWKDFAVAT
jgi:hypothetical protein